MNVLKQVKELAGKIEKLKELIERLDSLLDAQQAPTDKERVQGSSNKDKSGLIICKKIDAEKELERLEADYIVAKAKAIEAIARAEKKSDRDLLYMFYIEFQTIDYISRKQNYSYRHTCRRLNRATQEVLRSWGECQQMSANVSESPIIR